MGNGSARSPLGRVRRCRGGPLPTGSTRSAGVKRGRFTARRRLMTCWRSIAFSASSCDRDRNESATIPPIIPRMSSSNQSTLQTPWSTVQEHTRRGPSRTSDGSEAAIFSRPRQVPDSTERMTKVATMGSAGQRKRGLGAWYNQDYED